MQSVHCHGWPSTMAADAGEVTLLGLLDMSAAFDTVDHSILVNRLETSFGFSGSVLSWLESFLSSRTQQVVFNNTVSDVAEVRRGVPQGSVLGPLLFLLYSADVPLIAACNGLGIHCYADDGQLYFHGKAGESANITTRITNCIEEIDGWMSSNRLKLNSEKTQFIWIGTSQQLNKVPVNAINIGSSSVPINTTVNNLGVIFDPQLVMKAHIKKSMRCVVLSAATAENRQEIIIHGGLQNSGPRFCRK